MTRFSQPHIIRIALLFTLLLIPNICALFMAADMEGSWVMKIGYMGMVAICLLIPALIFKARTYFIIEGILNFLFMPIDIGSLYLNKQSASKLFLNSILQTNPLEAIELLQSLWSICLVVFILWGLYIYLCITLPNLPLFSKKLRYYGIIAALLMTMATYAAQTLLIYTISPNYTTSRLMKESMDKLGLKFLKIYPYNIYINASRLLQEQREWRRSQEDLNAFTFGITKRDSIDNTLFILYIGEAARYDHFAINNYSRNTTPYLSALDNAISFESIYAQANLTNYSIPFILTPEEEKELKYTPLEKET